MGTGFGYVGGPDKAAHMDNPVTTYSGGWKMKMQLCAAKLMNADVLMLDEPTGHLDVDNIKWLEDWLESFPGSIICTSHFSPFLDKMCTHIIDFKDYKGGVLIISHNKEFCDGVAQEKWIMNKGYLRIEGESVDTTKEDEEGGNKVIEDIVDASGNKIEQNAVDNSSDKDKKKKLKELEKKLKDGVKKKTLTDEEKWALEDQILELKEKLEAKKA